MEPFSTVREDALAFEVATDDSPLYVDLRKIASDNIDFRDCRRESFLGVKDNDRYLFRLAERNGLTAVFAYATFIHGGQVLSLPSRLKVMRPSE
jgi:hypothetical protein